jgi:hypothetical protein
LDFGLKFVQFILFNEFDRLHLLFDSSACATGHYEAQAKFESKN